MDPPVERNAGGTIVYRWRITKDWELVYEPKFIPSYASVVKHY